MLNDPRIEMKYKNSTTTNDRVKKEPKNPLFIIFVKHFQLKDSKEEEKKNKETNQAQHIYITARQLNSAKSFYIRPFCIDAILSILKSKIGVFFSGRKLKSFHLFFCVCVCVCWCSNYESVKQS